jgi:hypothetical protein
MSDPIICHGCGQAFPLPGGYTRNKIQCPACGVICPVPAGASAAPPARKAPAAAEPPPPAPALEEDASRRLLDPAPPSAPLDEAVPFAEAPAPPAPAKPEEPALPQWFVPKPQELVFKCRRCGRKVRRQGECPACDSSAPSVEERAEETPFAPHALELDEPPRPRADEEDEEGATPYRFADADVPTCPKCRKEMAPGAVVCLACGFDQRKKKKVAREFQPLARSWDTNLPLERRYVLLGAGAAFGLFMGITAGFAAGFGWFLFSWVLATAVLAFIVGTFMRVEMTRDRRGRVTLTKTWRVCFVPLKPEVVEVRGFEGIVSGQLDDTGCLDWFLFFWLLAMGILPGVLWYFLVIRKNVYHVALAQDHGYPAVYVYRGRSQGQMEDIATALRDATGLQYDPG